MKWDAERLYTLLPAIYRIRDQVQGEPLKALLMAIAEQIALLDEDLDQLYDDQFIETCADWVTPYIGDLVGYRAIHHPIAQLPTPRAEVANTIAYRRRKGTALVLEQLALDVTAWKAHAVEFFEQLITTQSLNHLRMQTLGSPDMRQWRPLEQLDTAFNAVAHTLDVRRIGSSRGKHNIPNVGLFLWRLQAYPLTSSRVRGVPIDSLDRLCYRFHPLGIDSPLFNFPRTEARITQLSEPINVPHPLSRRELYEELETLRQSIANRESPTLLYFQRVQPVFQVMLNGLTVPPEAVLICNLTGPRNIPNSKLYRAREGTEVSLPIQVAVDPVLGRLALPTSATEPDNIEVSYCYGFSSDLGGGPYSRQDSVFRDDLRPITWQIGVSQAEMSPQLVPTLAEAILAWNDQAVSGTIGVIAIMDSRTYSGLPAVRLPPGSQLLIVAADWPITNPTAPPEQRRVNGQLVPVQVRPHLIGSLVIQSASDDDSRDRTLFLNGLLLEGSVQLQTNTVQQLTIDHCTLTEGIRRTTEAPAQQLLDLWLNGVISGPITLPQQEATITIRNTLLDSALPRFNAGMAGERNAPVLTATLAHLEIQTSTILGTTHVRSIEATNSIFLRQVTTVRRQTGCVRFCYLPLASVAPQRYRCQPASPIDGIRIQPQFTSMRYDHPAYGQLSDRCPVEIRQGADDESEMGVFHDLYQPQRAINLRTRLDEYLRFGLEAGIFYAT